MARREGGSRIEVDGDIARVELTRGMWALIDAEDVPLVRGMCWYADQRGNAWYALSDVMNETAGRYRTVRMHRLILGLQGRDSADHRDGDGLNNRKSNLRACSHAENMRNRRTSKRRTVLPRGVSVYGEWAYCANVAGERVGAYETPEQAFDAYCWAAMQKYGEFYPHDLPPPPDRPPEPIADMAERRRKMAKNTQVRSVRLSDEMWKKLQDQAFAKGLPLNAHLKTIFDAWFSGELTETKAPKPLKPAAESERKGSVPRVSAARESDVKIRPYQKASALKEAPAGYEVPRAPGRFVEPGSRSDPWGTFKGGKG